MVAPADAGAFSFETAPNSNKLPKGQLVAEGKPVAKRRKVLFIQQKPCHIPALGRKKYY